MKKGFSILEITLGIALFSMIGTILFQSMMQITKTLKNLNELSSFDMRVAVVSNLLEKDLSGAFIPEIIRIKDEKEAEKTSAPQPKDVQKESSEKEKKKEKEYPPKAFYTELGEDEGLKMLTFISTNPIAVYDAGKAVPVRIMYTLEPFHGLSGTMTLKRQEGPEYMDLKLFTDTKNSEARKVEVVSALRTMKCVFWGLQKEEEEAKKTETTTSQGPGKNTTTKTTEKTKTKQKWVQLKQWNSDEKGEEEKPRILSLVPEFVQIKMTLATTGEERNDKHIELFLPTTSGVGGALLEGIKPVQEAAQKGEQKQLGKFDDLFAEDKLSSGLNEKLKQLDSVAKKPSPQAAPAGKRQ